MTPAETGVPTREEPAPPGAAYKPRLTRVLRGGVAIAYDHLGTVLIVSVLWITLALLLGVGGSSLLWQMTAGHASGAAWLSLLGGAAAAGIGTGPLTAALFEHARLLFSHSDTRGWELAHRTAGRWRDGLALAALQGCVSLILMVDALFFLSLKPALLRGLGAAFLYPILFWWGAALLQWPLAAERPADPLSQVVKKSFLLFLDNLGFAFGLTVAVLIFTLFSLLAPLGWLGPLARPLGWLSLIFLWPGLMAFLTTAALRELLPKYGLVPPVETEAVES